MLRFSVVVATYNRAASLRQTLQSFRHQTYANFELIVVNGPSTDETEAVLAEFEGQIRTYRCPKARLSMARNIGLLEAAGDVVAFIDDDSIPTPTWLAELAEVYSDPNVGAVGGLVYDHTGVKLQYRFAACNRDGRVSEIQPPLDRYVKPLADPVAYLQGTNMSFSRAALRAVGGFDENILHYYDDVEMCLQVIDHGYALKALDRAAVHHKFLASHIRNAKRMTFDPYNQICDHNYFVLQHGRGTRTTRELLDRCLHWADFLKAQAEAAVASGEMTRDQFDYHRGRSDEAMEVGLVKGFSASRKGVAVADADPESFVPFPTLQPTGSRLKVCFISREYPPGDFGGPGRYSHELAVGFAAAGHEVHVVTRSPDTYRLDLEEGAWIHRVPTPERFLPELDGVASAHHIASMAAVYHEVNQIHAQQPLDLVVAPLWLCEGLICSLDDRFTNVVTLITAMKAVATLAEWARTSPEAQQLVRFEDEAVAQCPHLHAISAGILDRSIRDYNADPARSFIAPLGLRDRSQEFPRRRPEGGRLRVLYVGRLETRKGADVFLEAAARLGREFPDVEFVLAGKEIPTDQGDMHRQRFEAQFAHDPDLRSRVIFTGMVTDEQLYQHYADCDIFCLPTHYESFGLVYVEAMIWGKPIVGSRVGGVPEVVADGDQGYLLPVGDVDAVTDALRRLIVDPGLRRRFGQRSRRLYEEKWATPVIVERMVQQFRGAVAKHRTSPGWNPNAAPRREKTTRLFADTLVRAGGLAPERARAAAERLLDPRCYPTDFVRQFQKRWHLPPTEFVVETFRIFFDQVQHLQGKGVQEWLVSIQNGFRRIDIVKVFAYSAEAKWRNLPSNWVDELEALCGPGEFAAPAPPEPAPISAPVAAVPAPRTLRQRFAGMKYLGKLLKYARRVIYLPWNFHKFYHQFGNGEHISEQVVRATAARQVATDQLICQQFAQLLPLVQQLAARQDGFRELLWKNGVTIATEQTELRTAVNEQTARVADALTGIGEVVEFPPPQANGELPHLPTHEQLRHAS